MIKINLLPMRAAKRKESARQQLVLMAGVLIIFVVVILALYSYLLMKISSTNDEIARSEQEIAELKVKIGKINELEKLKSEVTKKLDVLNQLRKGRTGPVQRLLTLSQSTPDKLWLLDYDEKDSNVTVKGMAFSEEYIATFMKSLEASPEFANVELVVSEQVDLSGIKMKKFELRFNFETPNATVAAAKKAGR